MRPTPWSPTSVRRGRIAVEDLARTLGREMRVRYFNPEWIIGMQAENYAGAREMAHFVEYLWGWQVTVPSAVHASKWEEAFAVYVQDKHDLDLKAFFNRGKPLGLPVPGRTHARSGAQRILAGRRGRHPQAGRRIRGERGGKRRGLLRPHLQQPHAQPDGGSASSPCPGFLAPKMVEQFKLAVEKAAAKSLAQQTADRRQLMAELTAGPGRSDPHPADPKRKEAADGKQSEQGDDARPVEGYKMEAIDAPDDATELTSSGIQWAASLFVLAVVALFSGVCGGMGGGAGEK